MAPSIVILSSLASLISLLLMSNSKKQRKSLKSQYNSGYVVSLTLTYVYAPQVNNICVLVRSICKWVGVYSCKGQKAEVLLQKSYLWSFLEHSRRWFDVG